MERTAEVDAVDALEAVDIVAAPPPTPPLPTPTPPPQPWLYTDDAHGAHEDDAYVARPAMR